MYCRLPLTGKVPADQQDYLGEFIYENGTLKKILFDGGYVDMIGDSPVYMFFIKDHLGSVRAVVSETGEVLQTNEFYPYGDLFSTAETAGSNGNRYRFIGKELGDETGLYDFSARFLQTSLGRFTTIDPLAEKYPSVSPYAYCNGNPVRYIDPDGMYFDEVNDKRAQRMERRLERKAEKLSAEADRKEKRQKDTGDLRERAGELRKSVQDIRDMRNDTKTEYRWQGCCLYLF